MSDIKISALPVASSLNDSDVFPLVQSGVTKKSAFSTLKDYLDASYIPLSGTVSPITGNLEFQNNKSLVWNNGDIQSFIKQNDENAIELRSKDTVGLNNSYISISPISVDILYSDVEFSTLSIQPFQFVIDSGFNNFLGIKYAQDFSANFTSQSLPNLGYIQSNFQPLSNNLTSLSSLTYSSASFVKMTASGTFALDTNIYLTGNQTITLSGDVTGSGTTAITTSISNTVVTGKLLTGYVSGAGTVSATDSILQAIQKLNGNISALTTGVSSVSGTTNRITASPTSGAVVVDISASYVGQSSITTLGTVTSGGLGTGATIGGVTMSLGSDATGDIYYRSSGGVLTRIAAGSRGTILQVGASSVPQWNSNILDSNGNTLLGLTTVGSSVNFWTLSNAVLGNSPILSTPNSGAGTDQVGIGGQIDLGLGTGAGNSGRLVITTGGITTTGTTVQSRFSLLQVGNLNGTNSGLLLNQPTNNLTLSSTLYTIIQGNTGLFINSPIAATSMVFRINNATYMTGTTSALTLPNSVVLNMSPSYVSAGTTGNRTSNTTSGNIRIAAGGTTATLTNSLIGTNTRIFARIGNDTTAKSVAVTESAGSCVFTLNQASTAEVELAWFLLNS